MEKGYNWVTLQKSWTHECETEEEKERERIICMNRYNMHVYTTLRHLSGNSDEPPSNQPLQAEQCIYMPSHSFL